MAHLPMGPSHFAELRVFIQTNTDKEWKRLYRQPQIGATFRGFNLANKDLLGYGLGVAAYLSTPVIIQNRFIWHLEVGAGPGFISKPFDLEDNYKNIAIGSHGNVFIMLGQRLTYHATDRLDLAIGTAFNHFSNAAFSLPNLGLNYPTISLGLSYRPSRVESDSTAIARTKTRIESNWLFSLNGGVKQSIKPYNAKFPTFSLTSDRIFGISRKSSLALGLDFFYNEALYQYRNALGEAIDPQQNIQSGVHFGYGLHVADAMLLIQMGAYVLDSYKRDGFLYHRVGIRYFITDHLGMSLSLKTHFFKADYFELGLTYRI
ncbi:MAG: acyloxyacyl hydrolase [Salibacteraceae bacterium]